MHPHPFVVEHLCCTAPRRTAVGRRRRPPCPRGRPPRRGGPAHRDSLVDRCQTPPPPGWRHVTSASAGTGASRRRSARLPAGPPRSIPRLPIGAVPSAGRAAASPSGVVRAGGAPRQAAAHGHCDASVAVPSPESTSALASRCACLWWCGNGHVGAACAPATRCCLPRSRRSGRGASAAPSLDGVRAERLSTQVKYHLVMWGHAARTRRQPPPARPRRP